MDLKKLHSSIKSFDLVDANKFLKEKLDSLEESSEIERFSLFMYKPGLKQLNKDGFVFANGDGSLYDESRLCFQLYGICIPDLSRSRQD